MSQPRVLIAGGGGVLGQALVAEFSGAGYAVAALGRTTGRSSAVAKVLELACDLRDPAATRDAVARVAADLGPVDVLVYNAAHLVVAPFAELAQSDFEQAWRVCVAGAVACAQAVLPEMLRAARGTLIFTGATASVRGTAGFAAFACAKFALRGLAQSLAREYQTQGVHVAHVVLDGLLLGSASVQRFGGSDSKTINPADVARSYRWLAEQLPSAWTHELDLRPSSERF